MAASLHFGWMRGKLVIDAFGTERIHIAVASRPVHVLPLYKYVASILLS